MPESFFYITLTAGDLELVTTFEYEVVWTDYNVWYTMTTYDLLSSVLS